MSSIQRSLLYLTIIAGFVGSAVLTIDVGLFHLFLYRISSLLLLMLFVINLLINQGRVDISHIKVKPYLQFLGFWLYYAVLSLAWASVKGEGIREIIFLFMAFSVIFFAVFYFRNLKDFKWFYNLWLLILLGMIGLGFWNHLTGQHLSEYWNTEVPPWCRFVPVAVFQGTNDFAVFLSLSIPFVLTFIRYNSKLIGRILGIIVLISAMYLLLVTCSRANYIAVLMAIVFWFFFLMRIKPKFKALVVAGLVVLFLLATLPVYVQDAVETVGEQLASVTPENTSTAIRINLIRDSFILLFNSAGFGVGAGNVEFHMANIGTYDTKGIPYVHNWWMGVLVEYGILIFAGYVMFYLGLLAGLYKAYRKLTVPSEKMICEALLMGLVALFLASVCEAPVMAQTGRWFFFAFSLAFLNYCRIQGYSNVVQKNVKKR